MTGRQGTAALVVVAVLWGIAFPAIKVALRDSSPLVFLATRFLLAALLVAGLARGMRRADLRGGALLALLFWGGFVFQTVGLAHTTPSRSAFITSLSTVFVPIVVFVRDRTLPRAAVVAGIGIAGAGMYLLTDPTGGGLNTGDLLTLGCAALFAGQIVTVGTLANRIPSGRLLVLQLALTGTLSLAVAPVLETPRLEVTRPFLLALAFLVTSAVGTFWLQLRAQRVVPATNTALIFLLEPVAAALTSFLMFGETLAPLQWLGAACILAGTVVPEFARGGGATGGGATGG